MDKISFTADPPTLEKNLAHSLLHTTVFSTITWTNHQTYTKDCVSQPEACAALFGKKKPHTHTEPKRLTFPVHVSLTKRLTQACVALTHTKEKKTPGQK